MDAVEELAPYRTNSLFLLVGKNPLPNYVAGKLLLQPKGTLYLIHSSGAHGTGDVAQYLAAQFPDYRTRLVKADARNYAAFTREIERYLQDAPSGPIGLHYTGGTKVMAVLAHRTVDRFCAEWRRPAYFSYLDADRLEMTIEHPTGKQALRRRVIDDVRPSLETLFALQGVPLRGKLDTDPVFLDLVGALVQLHSSEAGIQAWRKGRDLLLRSDGRPWSEVEADLQEGGLPGRLTALLTHTFGFDGTEPLRLQRAARHAGMKTSRELRLWLEGYWLENWVLACVQRIGIERRARSVENQAGRMFEIDVAFMRGYLLVALSCTARTDGRRAKEKFFEIYNRARHLGGDEARAGLVCAMDDPVGLEKDVAHQWYAGDRLRVFGREHLADLDRHLNVWIERI